MAAVAASFAVCTVRPAHPARAARVSARSAFAAPVPRLHLRAQRRAAVRVQAADPSVKAGEASKGRWTALQGMGAACTA